MSEIAPADKRKRAAVVGGISAALAMAIGVTSCNLLTTPEKDERASSEKGDSFTVPDSTAQPSQTPGATEGAEDRELVAAEAADPSDTSRETDPLTPDVPSGTPDPRTEQDVRAQGEPFAEPDVGDPADPQPQDEPQDPSDTNEDRPPAPEPGPTDPDPAPNPNPDPSPSPEPGPNPGPGPTPDPDPDPGPGPGPAPNPDPDPSPDPGPDPGSGDEDEDEDEVSAVDVDALVSLVNGERPAGQKLRTGAAPDSELYELADSSSVFFLEDGRSAEEVWDDFTAEQRATLLRDVSERDDSRIVGSNGDPMGNLRVDEYILRDTEARDDTFEIERGKALSILAAQMLSNDRVLAGEDSIVAVEGGPGVTWDESTGSVSVDTAALEDDVTEIVFTYTIRHTQDPEVNRSGNDSESTATVTVQILPGQEEEEEPEATDEGDAGPDDEGQADPPEDDAVSMNIEQIGLPSGDVLVIKKPQESSDSSSGIPQLRPDITTQPKVSSVILDLSRYI